MLIQVFVCTGKYFLSLIGNGKSFHSIAIGSILIKQAISLACLAGKLTGSKRDVLNSANTKKVNIKILKA